MAFHVPELSRITSGERGSDWTFGNNGTFICGSPEPGWELFFICSDGMGLEHVSVSARRGTQTRTPSWREMAYVKNLCWDDEDCAMQFHPKRSQYVNYHPNVLHMWRPIDCDFPTPDPLMVGPVDRGVETI